MAARADDEARSGEVPATSGAPRKPRTPAAERALAEAAARRAERERATAARPAEHPTEHPTEHPSRGGLDPARYGDWEVKGIASDF